MDSENLCRSVSVIAFSAILYFIIAKIAEACGINFMLSYISSGVITGVITLFILFALLKAKLR